jgi:hypothetical protein
MGKPRHAGSWEKSPIWLHAFKASGNRTRRQLGGLFILRDLGPKQLVGFTEPQRAWRVLGDSGTEKDGAYWGDDARRCRWRAKYH